MNGCESGYTKYGNGCYAVPATIPQGFRDQLAKFHSALDKLSYPDAKAIRDVMSARYTKSLKSKAFQSFPDSRKDSYKLFLETIANQ